MISHIKQLSFVQDTVLQTLSLWLNINKIVRLNSDSNDQIES